MGASQLSENLIGNGVVVAVVGPSGAGKDSVMNYARERMGKLASDVTFMRRVITRPDDGDTEDHDSVDEQSFAKMAANGEFAAYWRANGLSYGLRTSMDDVVRAGGVVVANVSRTAIPALKDRYAHVLPVVVTAPAAILAERLKARGRESHDEVLSRLERAEARELAVDDAVTIVNGGELAVAGEAFLATLRKASAWSDVSETV